MLDRYQGRFVGPVLDHLPGAPPDPIGQVHRIGAETSEEGEEMRPGDDVDRVELDDTRPDRRPGGGDECRPSRWDVRRQNPGRPGQFDEPERW